MIAIFVSEAGTVTLTNTPRFPIPARRCSARLHDTTKTPFITSVASPYVLNTPKTRQNPSASPEGQKMP